MTKRPFPRVRFFFRQMFRDKVADTNRFEMKLALAMCSRQQLYAAGASAIQPVCNAQDGCQLEQCRAIVKIVVQPCALGRFAVRKNQRGDVGAQQSWP